MGRKTNVDRAIRTLRQIEVLQAKGATVIEGCREVGVSEQTYYRWRKEYGRLSLDQARRLKELEKENDRLKRLVADLSLDNVVLREVTSGN